MTPMLKQVFKYVVPVLLVVALAVVAAMSDPQDINGTFKGVVDVIGSVVFSSLPDALSAIWDFLRAMPLVILVLVGGAIFFTLRFNFINVLGFWHALEVVRGKYDNPEDPGEISHFQALSSALSATVGLGNIAGVAMAVVAGGPGAIFWMMCAAFFGMASKFAECTLGQMYRRYDAEGAVQGGPMVYLRDGLSEIGWPNLGKYLSVGFAVLCIGGSFGGGNMYQSNQSFSAVSGQIPWLAGEKATGEVELRATQALTLRLEPYKVRFVAPEDEAAGQNTDLIYEPYVAEGELFELSEDDWRADSSGALVARVPVVSIAPGKTKYNAQAGLVDTLQLATLDPDRQLQWSSPQGVSVSQPSVFSGATPHKGGLFGIVLVILVAVVIVGGIKSVGKVADKIVPLMCGLYLIGSLWVIVANVTLLDDALGVIWREAFTPQAGVGGLLGVLITGVKRAAFSSEAGVGSAAIAHSAAKTDEPIREGIVALLEPFIDTIVVCFMTGMVITITGVYNSPETAHLKDVALTAAAFGRTISWFPYVLSLAVFLFAYSTMISWSYYGERCWTFLFGSGQSMVYRIIFLGFVWIGCVIEPGAVTDFSDFMILSMAFPNIIGVVMLSPKIFEALESYWTRYKAGEFKTYP